MLYRQIMISNLHLKFGRSPAEIVHTTNLFTNLLISEIVNHGFKQVI